MADKQDKLSVVDHDDYISLTIDGAEYNLAKYEVSSGYSVTFLSGTSGENHAGGGANGCQQLYIGTSTVVSSSNYDVHYDGGYSPSSSVNPTLYPGVTNPITNVGILRLYKESSASDPQGTCYYINGIKHSLEEWYATDSSNIYEITITEDCTFSCNIPYYYD